MGDPIIQISPETPVPGDTMTISALWSPGAPTQQVTAHIDGKLVGTDQISTTQVSGDTASFIVEAPNTSEFVVRVESSASGQKTKTVQTTGKISDAQEPDRDGEDSDYYVGPAIDPGGNPDEWYTEGPGSSESGSVAGSNRPRNGTTDMSSLGVSIPIIAVVLTAAVAWGVSR